MVGAAKGWVAGFTDTEGAPMYHDDEEQSTLADLAQMVDSPMMRVMAGEVVDVDTHTGLVVIAAYEDGLGLSA